METEQAFPPVGVTWSPTHTREIFDPMKFNLLVTKMMEELPKIFEQYNANAIAVSGHSGIILAGALAFQLRIPVFAVRKGHDTRQDDELVNGFFVRDRCRYVILDDLISSGATVTRIIQNINLRSEQTIRNWRNSDIYINKENAKTYKPCEPVAIALYNQGPRMVGKRTIDYSTMQDGSKTVTLPIHYLPNH